MYGLNELQNFRGVACPGLYHSLDHGHDALTITIPRRCLENPQWIRVGSFSEAWEKNGVITTIDNGQLDGFDDRNQDLYMFARIPKP
jgi:hypothetical protein